LYFKSLNAPFFKKLMPIAEKRLRQIHLQLESPVVVIGDASYSMDVAIRVATVISSVLTALCGAELKFFTGESVDPPIIPKNVPQVLDVATGVKADGLTAPAAALWPYYAAKKIVKFFIIVTDEIENEKYKNFFFPELFLKYYKEIYPSKIVFVSFLENPSEKGRMVTALENMGIVPLQFKLDGKRPDLTKLDSLLGLLASESTFFPKQVQELKATVKEKGINGALDLLSIPREEDMTSTTSTAEISGKTEVKREEKKEKSPLASSSDMTVIRAEMFDLIHELQSKNAELKQQLVEVPDEFIDVITQELMEDPVCTSDGHSYDKKAILKWFEKSNTSPKTGLPLDDLSLRPNLSLKSQILAFRERTAQ